MQYWRKFNETLNKVVDFVSGVATFLIIVVVLVQIIGRLIGNPAPWTEEATRFIFIWMIFLGIATGFRNSESARVTVLIDRFPKKFEMIKQALYNVFSVLFFLYMIIYGFQIMMQQVNMNEMGSAFRIPMWYIGIAVPVSGILGIIATIEYFLKKKTSREGVGK